MYNSKFIAELFRGQDVYSMQSTRQIFDKLAHSSIMRLNESSMDKAPTHAHPLLAASHPGGSHVWVGASPRHTLARLTPSLVAPRGHPFLASRRSSLTS